MEVPWVGLTEAVGQGLSKESGGGGHWVQEILACWGQEDIGSPAFPTPPLPAPSHGTEPRG